MHLDPLPFRLLLQSILATIFGAIAAGCWIGTSMFEQRLVRRMALFWTFGVATGCFSLIGQLGNYFDSLALIRVGTVGFFVFLFASVATLPSAFAEVQERPEPPAVLRTRILRSVAVSTVLGVVVVLMTPVAPRQNGLEVSRVPIAVLMLVACGSALWFYLQGRNARRNSEVHRLLVTGMVLLASRPLQQAAIAGSWTGYPGPNQAAQLLSIASAMFTMLAVAYTQLAAAVEMERALIDARSARLRSAEGAASRRRRLETAGYLATGIARNVTALVGAVESVRAQLATEPFHDAELAIIDAVQAKGRALLAQLREPDETMIEGHRLEIGTLVEVALPRVRRMLPDVEIRWTPSTQLHHTECPPEEFSRALMNLVLFLNAGLGEQRCIDVRLSSQRLDAPSGLLAAGNYARLSVQGMPKPTAEHDESLFESASSPIGVPSRDGALGSLRRFARLLGGDALAERNTSGRLTIHLWLPDDTLDAARFETRALPLAES